MSGLQGIVMWDKRAFEVGEVVPGPGKEGLRILRLLAEGGFSEVHEGVCEPSGTHYAVKALRLKHTGNAKTIERMVRESNTLYRLRHPHVVPVYFVGMRRADQLIYMVMKLLRGRNLREFQLDLTMAKRDGAGRPSSYARLPVSWVLEIVRKVCDGLHAVHTVAIHRDLKPENIFLDDDGSVILIDIGSAKFPKDSRLTTRDMTIGTAEYMSPEQIFTPEQMGPQSDLFAIGVILYELLSGVMPFQAHPDEEDNTRTLGIRIMWHPHTPLRKVAGHLPDYLVDIVERLLRKDPRERYGTAREVHDALSVAHARFMRELGDLAPAPLAETIATIPRAPLEAQQGGLPSLPPTTVPAATAQDPLRSGADEATERTAAVTMATEELPVREALLPSGSDEVKVAMPTGSDPEAREEPPAGVQPSHGRREPEPTEALPPAVAELPDDLRDAFVLSEVRGKSIGEVAQRIGAPEWLVRQRIIDAYAWLKARRAGGSFGDSSSSNTGVGVATTLARSRVVGTSSVPSREVMQVPHGPHPRIRRTTFRRVAAIVGTVAALSLAVYGGTRASTSHRGPPAAASQSAAASRSPEEPSAIAPEPEPAAGPSALTTASPASAPSASAPLTPVAPSTAVSTPARTAPGPSTSSHGHDASPGRPRTAPTPLSKPARPVAPAASVPAPAPTSHRVFGSEN
jgi:serine/threonine protein kinase